MMRILPALLIAAMTNIASPAIAKSPTLPAGWATYTNTRFDYRVCYPATAMVARAEADNKDGRVFVGTGRVGRGTELRVWGQHNALDQSIEAAFAADVATATTKGSRVTYKTLHKGWYVVSGQGRGKIFYIKKILRRGQFFAMELRYPSRHAEYWNNAVVRISNCFGPS